MAKELTIYCADIGSVAKDNFGWARLNGAQSYTDSCIVALADDVASTLAEGRKVALGFECPLWVPVSKNPQCLTKPRRVDGGRPWSAAAGASVLATGFTEVAWILDEVRVRLRERGAPLPSVYLDWSDFEHNHSGLFLWEAFVTGKAKASRSGDTNSHVDDALYACQEFASHPPDPAEKYGSGR